MRAILTGFILCVAIGLPTAAWSAKPLGVENTDTAGHGNIVLELTDELIKDGDIRITRPTLAVTIGAGAKTDFTLELPYLRMNPSRTTGEFASGPGDARITMKRRLFKNEVNQSMAFKLYMDVPTGDSDKGLGTNKVLWGFALIDTQECRGNCLHMNLGYESVGSDIKQSHFAQDYAITFGIAGEYKLSESFRGMSQFAGESRKKTDIDADTSTYTRPLTLMTGFIWDISKSFYADFGVRAGLNKYAEDYAALAGMAWKF